LLSSSPPAAMMTSW